MTNSLNKSNSSTGRNPHNKLLMQNKPNNMDYLLKYTMKNENINTNFTTQYIYFLNSKNNQNQKEHFYNKDKSNFSTQDDLEKLLQLENDYSFSVDELEAAAI